LETNVVIPGVFIAHAAALLLAPIAFLAIAGLVVLAVQQRFPKTARRVVLQRAILPVYPHSSSTFRSAMLPSSLEARAPPTLPSDLANLDGHDPYGS
jgi:hypothetical protein